MVYLSETSMQVPKETQCGNARMAEEISIHQQVEMAEVSELRQQGGV
jgi:hypothetical protein